MKTKIGFLMIMIFSLLFLNGCLSCSEKMTLNKDFSGKANIKFAITDMLFGMMGQSPASYLIEIEKTFKSSPKVKLVNSKTYAEMGNQVFDIDIQFQSIEDLNTIRDKNEVPPFIGKISLIKGKNGKVTIKRILFNTNQETINSNMKSALAGYKWTYELQLPYKVLDANTAPSYIDLKTNTVKWEISLLSLYNKPQEMTVTVQTFDPIIYIYLAGAVIVLGLVAIGYIYIRKRKKEITAS